MSLEKLKAKASETIEKAANDLNRLSQEIWKNPELAYNEHHAHKVLTEYLEGLGFNVQKKYKVDTAFRTEWGDEKATPNVAVLCEYDALPGIGHGCGHNLIAEVGIGASLGIKAALELAEKPLGKLTILGAPAEEEGGGKVDLIQGRAFDDVDFAIMSHPSPHSAVKSGILAMTEVTATYHGQASHASGFPWKGVNALDAAVLAYQNFSCLRQQLKPSWRVHGIFTKAGEKPNIIPEEAELYYYLRAPTEAELNQLIEKAKACLEGAAQATGCTVDLKWDPKPYLNLITNKTIVTCYHQNALAQGVEFTPAEVMANHQSGSTDMGNVSHVVPAIHPHFYIGTQASEHTHEFRKAAGTSEAQIYTLREAKILAMTALDIMYQPGLLQKMKQDFLDDLA